ncbi:MAG TPA: NADH-quinone oxidoreductase subunit NuoG [Dongiaceae bacterium]|nr:NADH-quinone oxidoreductase subunit NuoG [Dongiaceae bacterium]
MATIFIDDEKYIVEGDKNLLQAALELGLDLPYFCWHPAMGSVGSCRQCAVKQFQSAEDQRGRIVMGCMTPVSEGMRVSLKDQSAQTFRDQCIEALMANHPHDCPVCEEGGECHLQDMTNMSQHQVRVYRGKKRTFRNQQLGPFINHEMNRCITCYRCVRFYRDYAGGRDLHALASRNHVYFGRHEPGTLENVFSGNLVEVCPTGVFTDKTFSRHFSRKWDLQSSASICVHCAHGCNISPGERSGMLRRIVNRYNGAVNGYFLCDRGRFGYEFVNSEQRITAPLLEQAPVVEMEDEAPFVLRLGAELQAANLIGIGSPRASLEANFALMEWVGKKNFYAGINKQELHTLQSVLDILRSNPATTPTLKDIEQADAVLIVGEDVLNTDPRLALAIRQATQNKAKALAAAAHIRSWDAIAVQNHARHARSPLYILATHSTGLDEIAEKTHADVPQNLARLSFAIAHKINAAAPSVDDMTPEESDLVEEIANVLLQAKHPLIVTGTQTWCVPLIQAAATIAKATALLNLTTRFACVVPECNSLGVALLTTFAGSASSLRPLTLEDAVNSVLNSPDGVQQTVVILENDLYRRLDRSIVDTFLESAGQVIALDHLHNNTSAKADIVLPAATFAETHGTLVSSEGRAQRHFGCYPAAGAVQPSWQWITQLDAKHSDRHFDQLTAACASAVPELGPIVDAAPAADFRVAGVKVARQTHRYSGRTALRSHIRVSEAKQESDAESALAYSMEGLHDHIPSSLRPDYWSPAWNSNEAINKFQSEMAGELKQGDPGVRLFEPLEQTLSDAWYGSVPERWRQQTSVFQAYPVPLFFGSEELSNQAVAIKARITAPVLYLHADDAQRLQIKNHDAVQIASGDITLQLRVSIAADVAPGSVGVPIGHPDLAPISSGFFQKDVVITRLAGSDGSVNPADPQENAP